MTDDQRIMLDELLEVDDGLSDWEVEFVEDLDRHADRELTDKQESKLEQIWQKVFG